jgi:putative FmdB family regulatory protein
MPASQPAARTKSGRHERRRLVRRAIYEFSLRTWGSQKSPRSLRTFHKLILIATVRFTGAIIMPIFEYICQDCSHEFETLVFGRDKAKCPKCESKKLSPQLSVFAMSTKGVSARSSSSPAPRGGCGSCGDPRGPGACSLGDLD